VADDALKRKLTIEVAWARWRPGEGDAGVPEEINRLKPKDVARYEFVLKQAIRPHPTR